MSRRSPDAGAAQDPGQEPAPGSLWRLPAMLLVAGYTFGAFTGFSVTLSALPAWLVRGGTSQGVAGLATTALLVVTVVTELVVPRLLRWFGLTRVLCAGLVFLGAPSLLLLVPAGFGWVVGVSAVRGVGFGIVTVLTAVMTARVVPASRRGEAVGIYGLSIAVPSLFAVPGGVALVTAGHFLPVAVIGAVPTLGLGLIPWLRRAKGLEPWGPAGSHAAHRDGSVRREHRSAGFAALGPSVVLLVAALAEGGFLTYLPIARPKGSLATIGLLVWGGAGALARWRVGHLADRSGLRWLLPASSVVSVVGILVVVFGLVLHGRPSWVAILAGAAVFGVGFGATLNLTLVAAFARARQRSTSTVSAVWNAGFDGGIALGAAVVGALTAAASIPVALALTAGLVAAGMPLAMWSARPVRPRFEPADEGDRGGATWI